MAAALLFPGAHIDIRPREDDHDRVRVALCRFQDRPLLHGGKARRFAVCALALEFFAQPDADDAAIALRRKQGGAAGALPERFHFIEAEGAFIARLCAAFGKPRRQIELFLPAVYGGGTAAPRSMAARIRAGIAARKRGAASRLQRQNARCFSKAPCPPRRSAAPPRGAPCPCGQAFCPAAFLCSGKPDRARAARRASRAASGKSAAAVILAQLAVIFAVERHFQIQPRRGRTPFCRARRSNRKQLPRGTRIRRAKGQNPSRIPRRTCR